MANNGKLTDLEQEKIQCSACEESSSMTDIHAKDTDPSDQEVKRCPRHLDQDLTHCCITCYVLVCSQCMLDLGSDICLACEKHTFKKPTKHVLSTIVEKHKGYITSIQNEVKRHDEILKKVDDIEKRLQLERRNIEEAVDKRAEMLTAEIRRWTVFSKAEVKGQADATQRQIDDYRRDIEFQLQDFSTIDAKLSDLIDRLLRGDMYCLQKFVHETEESKQTIINAYAGTYQRAKTPSTGCKFYLNEEIRFTEPLDMPYIEENNRDFIHFGGFKLHSLSHISRFTSIVSNCEQTDQAFDKNKIQLQHLHSFVLKDWEISGFTINKDEDIIITNSRKNSLCVFKEDARVKTVFALETGCCDEAARPVAALPDGSVAVAEFNSGSLYIFKQGKRSNVIRRKDNSECRDIACDTQGQIILACKSKSRKSKKDGYCGKVEMHDASRSKKILSYPEENGSKTYFSEPISVTINNLTGDVVVADSDRKEIIGIKKDGSRSFGYSCADPRAVRCDVEGRIYILDVGNGGIIHVLTKDGKTRLTDISCLAFKPFDPLPSFMEISGGGKLFLANERNMVKVFKCQFKRSSP